MAASDCLDPLLIERVLSEYREMPGLALTLGQACRLWGCDVATGCRLAELLVERRLLRWSGDHRLVRVGGEP